LIARAREQLGSVCEEVLLNKLLNEMDGLREDADVLFILTTNRPDQLEPALASRPGRIDQAIEFPLPDEQGRSKLVKLYARGVRMSEQLTDLIVRRTKGASPAFIRKPDFAVTPPVDRNNCSLSQTDLCRDTWISPGLNA
jgi:ATP-dependent 26S proteasome regulatory subunit